MYNQHKKNRAMLNNKFNFLKIFCYLYPIIMLSSCTTALVTVGVIGGGALIINTAAKDQTIGSIIDDTVIVSKIKKNFARTQFHDLYNKIYVSVLRGRVFLCGFVSSENDILEAVNIAKRQKGVVDVINEIKINEDSDKTNFAQYAIDTGITSLVRTKLLLAKSVKSSNYEVFTHYNIVYIFGLARSEEEMDEVTDIISKTNDVEEVVSYITITHDK